MGYLLSKQFNTENIHSHVSRSTHSYKLYYKLPYCVLNGISFTIKVKHISTTKNEYYVQPEKSSISLIHRIDDKIKQLTNKSYSPILKNNSIYFRKNDITTKLLSNHKDFITLNIINIKNNAYHCYPIVYIV